MQRESAGESAQAGVHDMPPIDFSQFVLSLATSAQMAMGLVQHPASEATTQDLPAARQTIEILAMLHEKTRGNLQPEERKLFEEILYLLRMQYVEITKKP
ncbi:MAG: DUF1844 domain-containing protein [Deltaproteobacteria bacterium]|nr:DUF1844 domain-containing protein [Deltaproteobacteria bacterium]